MRRLVQMLTSQLTKLQAENSQLRRTMKSHSKHPALWYGKDIGMVQNKAEWVHELTKGETAEIEKAVDAVVKRFELKQHEALPDGSIASFALYLAQMTKEEFVLPEFGKVLRAMQQEIVRGRGFSVLRG